MMSTDATLFGAAAFLCTDTSHHYTETENVGSSGDPEVEALLLDVFTSQQVVKTSDPVKCEPQQTLAKRKTRREKEMIRKRQYHRRLKSERETLRRMVDELSRQLLELQHVSGGATASLATSTWKNVAMLHRGQRVQAETEQMRLFTAAKMQALYMKELCEQLPNTLPSSNAWSASPHPTGPPFDESVYHTLLKKVNACYNQIDDVLGEFHRDGVTSSVHRGQFNGEMQYFQHLNQFTEPYDYEHTHRTMWNLAKLFHRQRDRRDFHGVGDSNDTVVIRFRLLRSLANGATISVLQRYVHRRFHEDKRTILVWKTLSEGEGVFQGIQSEETGWVCLQPAAEEDSTLVRVCVRQAPMRFQTPDTCDAATGEFHQVLQDSVSEDMQEISGALDKMLLDDTLQGIDI